MSKRRPTPRRHNQNRAMAIVQIFLLILVLVVILNIRFKFGEGASTFFQTLTAPDVDVSKQLEPPSGVEPAVEPTPKSADPAQNSPQP